jgi:hypothetical protein
MRRKRASELDRGVGWALADAKGLRLLSALSIKTPWFCAGLLLLVSTVYEIIEI